MTEQFKVFSNKHITNLFSIFVIGTLGFLLWIFLYFEEILPWKSLWMISIFVINSFIYLIILYSIIVHYLSILGIFLFNKINKNRKLFIFGLELFLGIVYLIIIGIKNSFWGFLINFPIVLLMIGAMYPTSSWIKDFCKRKWQKNKKQNSNKGK